jgi:hypothetical protein
VSAEEPRPSDTEPAIAECGSGDVVVSVVSMSQRHADGEDAAYLRWHLLDHLPEQYRLAELRSGQRWVSTPSCRAARAASEPPFEAVDHVVQYLFAEPVGPGLDHFFALGGALHRAGRMPIALPRVQVGGWRLDGAQAAHRALVGAAVLPWRPARGAYLLVERSTDAAAHLDALVAVDGVAGAWRWVGASPHERLEGTEGLTLTVCYLDDDPVEVAATLAPVLADRWAGGGVVPLLAAPFEAVVAGEWDRHLP